MKLNAQLTLDINNTPTTVTVHGTYFPGHDGKGLEPYEEAEMDIEYVRMGQGVIYPGQIEQYFNIDQIYEMEQALWEAHKQRKSMYHEF